ncbi:MAG: hypothetical protein ACMG6E_03735 [Candidatus Roizmanbacteria bacterium]
MIKAYLWIKMVHRLFLYLTSFLILFMSITGLLLKYPLFSGFIFLDTGLVRSLHNAFSIYFVISLGIMMLSGIYMYLFPLLRKRGS